MPEPASAPLESSSLRTSSTSWITVVLLNLPCHTHCPTIVPRTAPDPQARQGRRPGRACCPRVRLRLPVRSDVAFPQGICHRVRPVAQMQPRRESVHDVLDSSFGVGQLAGDLSGVQALGDQPQDVHLPWRESQGGAPGRPAAPRCSVPTWLMSLPSRSAGRSPSPRWAASTACTSRCAVASRRQTMAPTPHSMTSRSSVSRIVPTTSTARAPSLRTIRRSRPSAPSSRVSSISSATVPAAAEISSRTSTSGRPRNWLTAPSREIGSGAWTATGIRRRVPRATPGTAAPIAAIPAVPVSVVRGELSNRFPQVHGPAVRWGPVTGGYGPNFCDLRGARNRGAPRGGPREQAPHHHDSPASSQVRAFSVGVRQGIVSLATTAARTRTEPHDLYVYMDKSDVPDSRRQG